MFFSDSTVRTTNYGFGIGNDSMNPREKLSCSFWISKDNFVMRYIPSFCRSAIGPPSINTNRFQKIVPFFERQHKCSPRVIAAGRRSPRQMAYG